MQRQISNVLRVIANSLPPDPVPRTLQDLNIFKDPKGPKLWSKLCDQAGIETGVIPELLGSGTRGKAYKISNTKALKMTSDDKETNAAALMIDSPDPSGRAYKVFSAFELKGEISKAYAIVTELLMPLDLESERDQNWIEWSDLWPQWSSARNYAKLTKDNAELFIAEVSQTEIKNRDEFSRFCSWLIGLSEYLTGLGIQYHDFWHRNLLHRGNDFVAIDFGYSKVAEPENGFDIETISKQENC